LLIFVPHKIGIYLLTAAKAEPLKMGSIKIHSYGMMKLPKIS
jgi:hypothetical protein